MQSSFENTQAHAESLDNSDPLKHFRERFHIPVIEGKECAYFTGNSLGLQAKTVKKAVDQELTDWANWGVEGHFHAANPWYSYHEHFPKLLAPITGAKENELVVMNQLTVNVHLLMATFYRPTPKRYKILCEAKAFPSDQYALESQLKLHGLSVENALIEVSPRPGEHTIRTEDILFHIENNKDSLALVMMGGVNYYTGQVFDMETITKAAHGVGAYAGFDLAHAAGNIKLELHDWQVDFATWCSYKYLNSGPGGVSGVFIHEKHVTNTQLPRMAGWWGYDKTTRFKMESGFKPIPTAEGWQLSNAPVLSMAAHKASLELFAEAGFDNLRKKARMLSRFTFFVLNDINKKLGENIIEIITPEDENQNGCQVSIMVKKQGREVFEALLRKGIITDWREPNVIRIAPVPLYNRFSDIYRFGETIYEILK